MDDLFGATRQNLYEWRGRRLVEEVGLFVGKREYVKERKDDERRPELRTSGEFESLN